MQALMDSTIAFGKRPPSGRTYICCKALEIYSTVAGLNTLAQAMDHPVSPSTLSYRDRLRLREQEPFGYQALYSTGSKHNVWSRLTMDARGRTSRTSLLPPGPPLHWPEYCPQGDSFYSKGSLSGFITNTGKAVYTHNTFKAGLTDFHDRAPLETMAPQQLRKYRTNEQIDYRAQIRPDAETTNQTLRMFGTYEGDYAAARQAGVFIPQGCPGGTPWWHPDVTLRGDRAGPGTIAGTMARPHTSLGLMRVQV